MSLKITKQDASLLVEALSRMTYVEERNTSDTRASLDLMERIDNWRQSMWG